MFPVIRLSSEIHLPIYLVIGSLIFTIGLFWVVHRADHRGLNRNTTLDFALALMLGTFIGARILHVVYEEPSYYLENPLHIFYFWHGGFVYFGGMLGAWLATEFVFWKNKELDRGAWQELYSPLFPLGSAIGRVACLGAGCCYGKPTDLPWAITFPIGAEAPIGIPLHPTQIYMVLGDFLIFLIVLFIDQRKRKSRRKKLSIPRFFRSNGQLLFFWLFFHGAFRLIMEAFRADPRGPEIVGLSISTWISLGLMLISGILFIRNGKQKLAVEV